MLSPRPPRTLRVLRSGSPANDPELVEAEGRVYLLEVTLQARVPNPHLIGLLGRSYLIMNNPLYWFMFKLSVPHGIANEDVIPQNPGELSCKVK